MNHLGWVTSLRDGDQDLMDMVLERIERLVYLGVDASYLRASRAIPLPTTHKRPVAPKITPPPRGRSVR